MKRGKRYFVVDAFTRQLFGGNPAGVVLLDADSDFPDAELMRLVAAELRYSETAFVRHDGNEEFTVRYFTPASEVDLCGHATIAAYGVLRETGIVSDGAVCVNHTLAGDLKVIVGETVMMQMALPQVVDKHVDSARLHAIMGPASLRWPDMPVEIISTGLPDIIMPVTDLQALHDLAPDMAALTALSRELEVVGVHAFVLGDDGYTGHVRNFAPLYDVPEESATGTANAALTHYLHRRRWVAPGSECRFVQGEAMRRPSVVATTLRDDGSIWVGGECCIVACGEMMVW